METPACPITGSKNAVALMQVSDRFATEPTPIWNIVRVPESGMLMLSPRPTQEESAVHYDHDRYDPHMDDESAGNLTQKLFLAARKILLENRTRLILHQKPVGKTPRILEIGCSTGMLLQSLGKTGAIAPSQLIGVENNAKAAASSQRKGFRTVERLELLDQVSEAFDIIILWHTLEHLHDLEATLLAISRMLAREGKVIITLPNHRSPDARHYGANWIAWDAPRHLWHFEPSVLAALLAHYGFRIVKQQPWLADTIYNTIMSERRTAGGNTFTALLKAIQFSLRVALAPDNGSGMVYIATKNPG